MSHLRMTALSKEVYATNTSVQATGVKKMIFCFASYKKISTYTSLSLICSLSVSELIQGTLPLIKPGSHTKYTTVNNQQFT